MWGFVFKMFNRESANKTSSLKISAFFKGYFRLLLNHVALSISPLEIISKNVYICYDMMDVKNPAVG